MILAGVECGAGHVYTIYAPKRWACGRLPTRSQWLLLCTGKVYNVACSIYGCLFCCIPSLLFVLALLRRLPLSMGGRTSHLLFTMMFRAISRFKRVKSLCHFIVVAILSQTCVHGLVKRTLQPYAHKGASTRPSVSARLESCVTAQYHNKI
ncbi:hypothetical protein QBC45DRAFT_402844 [Copromyces sp. CBS 386.78]|nr:hypothetical protein QBC45DRAFT_402844 [Copromyces sp. CBS 386.78]